MKDVAEAADNLEVKLGLFSIGVTIFLILFCLPMSFHYF